MLSLFPIPRRKLTSVTSNNEILSQKRAKAWKIAHWSEENINFLFNYAAILINSQIPCEITSANVIGSSFIQIKYSNVFSEGLLILWNIASILSDSLIYFHINDKKTREIYKERISTILKIFYSLQTEYLPSIQLDSKSDLTIQNVAFYHAIYSAHYYEILLLIGEKNKENLTTITLYNMIASNYFEAAKKMNPFPSNFLIQNINYSSIEIIVNRIALYHIKSLISHSKYEEKELKIGSSIFFLNLALEALNSTSKNFRSTEFFTKLDHEITSKKKLLEEDNKRIYFCLVKCEDPLPEIQDVDEVLHTGIKSSLKLNSSNNDKIQKEVNEINQLIDKQREMLINSADSVSMLTSLLYECDSSRKKINSQIFASSNSDSQISNTDNKKNLPVILKSLSDIENDINIIFSWLSSAKIAHPSSFDVDCSCEKLSNLQERLRNTVGKYFMALDVDESEQILSSIKAEVNLIAISQEFLDDIAKKTDSCFQIMEKISSLN